MSSVRGVGDHDQQFNNSYVHFATEENFDSNNPKISNSLHRGRGARTPASLFHHTEELDISKEDPNLLPPNPKTSLRKKEQTPPPLQLETHAQTDLQKSSQQAYALNELATFGIQGNTQGQADPSKGVSSFRFVETGQGRNSPDQFIHTFEKTGTQKSSQQAERASHSEFNKLKQQLEADIRALELELEEANMQKTNITNELYTLKQNDPQHGANHQTTRPSEVDKGYKLIESGLLKELATAEQTSRLLDTQIHSVQQEINLVENEILYFEGVKENLLEAIELNKAENQTLSLELLNLNKQLEKYQFRQQQLQLQDLKIRHLREELENEMFSKTKLSISELRRAHDRTVNSGNVSVVQHVSSSSVRHPHNAEMGDNIPEHMLQEYESLSRLCAKTPVYPELLEKVVSRGTPSVKVDNLSLFRDGKQDACLSLSNYTMMLS